MDKLSKAMSRFVSNSKIVYGGILETLKQQGEICEMINKLMCVSDRDFALAFTDVAKQICYCKSEPFHETFISLTQEAIHMILSGVEETDVLIHFDEILEKMKGGRENDND